MTRIFHWFFMWKMDHMSGFDIRLVFTLPPRDSTLQYKRCVHFWNNFLCITSLPWPFLVKGNVDKTSIDLPFKEFHVQFTIPLGAIKMWHMKTTFKHSYVQCAYDVVFTKQIVLLLKSLRINGLCTISVFHFHLT